MWQNFVRDVIDRICDVFQNIFILTRDGVAIFADIIKILTIFILAIYKDSRKFKMNRNYVLKYSLYLYF